MNHRDFMRRNREVVLACARAAARAMEWGFTEPAHVGRGYLCADCNWFTPSQDCGSHLGDCEAPPEPDGIDAVFMTADVQPACRRFEPPTEVVREDR
jgi:hypothetical protein